MFPCPIQTAPSSGRLDSSSLEEGPLDLSLHSRTSSTTSVHTQTSPSHRMPESHERRTPPPFTRKPVEQALATAQHALQTHGESSNKAGVLPLGTPSTSSHDGSDEEEDALHPSQRTTGLPGTTDMLSRSVSLGPVEHAVLNSWLHAWQPYWKGHGRAYSTVEHRLGNGDVTRGGLTLSYILAVLRMEGLPMGKRANSTFYPLFRDYDPTKPRFATHRIEPSLLNYNLHSVPAPREFAKPLQEVFDKIAPCTAQAFVDEVARRYPIIPRERAWFWYFEDRRPGQIINWRTERSLAQTSFVIPTPASHKHAGNSVPAQNSLQGATTAASSRASENLDILLPRHGMTDAKRDVLSSLHARTAHWTTQQVHDFLRSGNSPLARMSHREISSLRDYVRKRPHLYTARDPIPGLTEEQFATWEKQRHIAPKDEVFTHRARKAEVAARNAQALAAAAARPVTATPALHAHATQVRQPHHSTSSESNCMEE